jgi:hypothetical protein
VVEASATRSSAGFEVSADDSETIAVGTSPAAAGGAAASPGTAGD